MYFANFYCHVRYGTVFLEVGLEKKKLHEKVMTLITNLGSITSCRKLFKTLNNVPFINTMKLCIILNKTSVG
jgi:hypothetical protein